MKLPRVTGREVVGALRKVGFRDDHQRGSHLTLRHQQTGQRVTVPIHAGKTLAPKTLQSILKMAGVRVAEFSRLLKDP